MNKELTRTLEYFWGENGALLRHILVGYTAYTADLGIYLDGRRTNYLIQLKFGKEHVSEIFTGSSQSHAQCSLKF